MNPGDEERTPEEMSAEWRDVYGDMVPKKIIDTKIGPDGRRYYKVQWSETTMESRKNFLEAELLVKKYWDPAEKKLKLPSGDSGGYPTSETTSRSSLINGEGECSLQHVSSPQETGSSSSKLELIRTNEVDDEEASGSSVTTLQRVPAEIDNHLSGKEAVSKNDEFIPDLKEIPIKSSHESESKKIDESNISSCRGKRVSLKEVYSDIDGVPPKKFKETSDD